MSSVRVRAEALARLHPVLVDDPQGAEAHVARVVVVGRTRTCGRCRASRGRSGPARHALRTRIIVVSFVITRKLLTYQVIGPRKRAAHSASSASGWRAFSSSRISSSNSAARQVPQQPPVQGRRPARRAGASRSEALGRDRHEDDPAVLGRALPGDQAQPLQPVDQPGDPRHGGDHAVGDLQDRQRLALAPQDAQDVVLRGGQAVLPEQPGEADAETVGWCAATFSIASCSGDSNGRRFLISCCKCPPAMIAMPPDLIVTPLVYTSTKCCQGVCGRLGQFERGLRFGCTRASSPHGATASRPLVGGCPPRLLGHDLVGFRFYSSGSRSRSMQVEERSVSSLGVMFPKSVFVQPDGVGIASDEFIDGHTFNRRRARNPLLLSVNEDHHVLLLSLAPRSLFGGGSSAFRTGHVSLPLSSPTSFRLGSRSLSSRYCGGDLPTRLMTRG